METCFKAPIIGILASEVAQSDSMPGMEAISLRKVWVNDLSLCSYTVQGHLWLQADSRVWKAVGTPWWRVWRRPACESLVWEWQSL